MLKNDRKSISYDVLMSMQMAFLIWKRMAICGLREEFYIMIYAYEQDRNQR